MRALFLLPVVALSWTVLDARRAQRVKVKGQLFCQVPKQEKEAYGVRVLLVDKDPGLDDNMAEGKTDGEGKFYLEGTEYEISDVDAELKIYHNCDDVKTPGLRRWLFKVPSRYINSNETYDLGRLNLESRLEEEERDFI